IWRTRRYLADAGAVQLTRNPDALAGALQRLAQDDTTVPGGGWASHLFFINPSGDKGMGGGPTQEQMREAAEVWAATATAGGTPRQTSSAADGSRVKMELAAAALAAVRGDARAIARL